MALVAPCGARTEPWAFDCAIADHNGLRWDEDTQDIWVPPDDGALHFDYTPIVKPAYLSTLGAEWNIDEVPLGSDFLVTGGAPLDWTNNTCHSYWVLTEYVMGTVVTELGADSTAFAGTHNELSLDGDSIVDTQPYIGSGYNATGVPGFGLASQFYPPTTWPVWTRVRPGQELSATLHGVGLVSASGDGDAETVNVRYGWTLRMTAWPIGVG